MGIDADELPELHHGFHWKDGWMFTRLNDGSVRITQVGFFRGYESAPPYAIVGPIYIDPHSWASIVSSMSKEGETSETYYAALERQLP